MIDVKDLSENPDKFRASQRARGADESVVDAIIAADSARRAALIRFENLRAEQNAFGKKVAQAKGAEISQADVQQATRDSVRAIMLIRAYRDAFGIDLQALVNADMRKAFGAYPKKWGLRRPDRNIDHRRVPNLARFLARMGAELPVPADGKGWQPGDIFTSTVGGSAPHIGLVSDAPGARGPLILHNIGRGAREEDALLDWPITGRFRWKV